MPLKSALARSLYTFFIIILSIWFVSLLVFSLSTSIWGKQTFPLTMNAYLRTILLVSAGLASFTSFFLGLYELGVLSALESHVKHYFEPEKEQPAPTDKPTIFAVIPSGNILEDQEQDETLVQLMPDNIRKKNRKDATTSDEE
jgi:hypothetical protein